MTKEGELRTAYSLNGMFIGLQRRKGGVVLLLFLRSILTNQALSSSCKVGSRGVCPPCLCAVMVKCGPRCRHEGQTRSKSHLVGRHDACRSDDRGDTSGMRLGTEKLHELNLASFRLPVVKDGGPSILVSGPR